MGSGRKKHLFGLNVLIGLVRSLSSPGTLTPSRTSFQSSPFVDHIDSHEMGGTKEKRDMIDHCEHRSTGNGPSTVVGRDVSSAILNPRVSRSNFPNKRTPSLR